MKKQVVSLLLALLLILPVHAVQNTGLDAALADTAQILTQTVSQPRYGSIGGEWVVLGLARGGCSVPEGYYQGYYDALADHVTACGGVLHQRKYTEYARVVLALSAIGADARDVAGYDLTAPLTDRDKVIWQGVNGPIYALLALDCRDYPAPEGLRQQYISDILSAQLTDGGWSLFGQQSDPDVTGMALQALAKYQDQPAVNEAIQKALACMSEQQSADGGFSTFGTATAESCAQMITALCELGISLDDPRFVKQGKTLLDGLLCFYKPGAGFRHTLTETSCNQMATEQAFYALVAVKRAQEGQSSLYRMGDTASQSVSYAGVLVRAMLLPCLAVSGPQLPLLGTFLLTKGGAA